MSTQFDPLIFQKGRQHGIDPFLIKAIIAAESNFDPRAYRNEPQINDASRGLMQVLLGTARWMGYAGPAEGLFDPETNVEFGTRFLKWLRNHFSGDTGKMISGYNTGPGNVRLVGGRFTNQAYVDRVLRYYTQFSAQKKTEVQGGVTLQPGLPQVGPIPISRQMTAPITLPPVIRDISGSAEELLGSLWTPQSAPWILAIAAALGIAVLSGRGSR